MHVPGRRGGSGLCGGGKEEQKKKKKKEKKKDKRQKLRTGGDTRQPAGRAPTYFHIAL